MDIIRECEQMSCKDCKYFNEGKHIPEEYKECKFYIGDGLPLLDYTQMKLCDKRNGYTHANQNICIGYESRTE